MKAEEKSKELVEKFRPLIWGNTMFTRNRRAAQAAAICVQEIIDSYSHYKGMYDQEFFDNEVNYWQTVLNLLNK